MDLTEKTNITRINREGGRREEDLIIRELPLTVMINGRELVTLLCSPGELRDLACGFLFFEGVIKDKKDIKDISIGKNNNYINIELRKGIDMPQDIFSRRIISSGCGKSSLFYDSQDIKDCKQIDSNMRVKKDDITVLMKELDKKSKLFKDTGGTHSAALASSGSIEVFAEDIGRHNALDKVFGKCLLNDINTEDKVILTTGRISSEIVIKVMKRGIPVLISRSAPTDMAVKLAGESGITLVGFARGTRMNIYANIGRII